MHGAFMCRCDLWDLGLFGSKSCHYICSTFPRAVRFRYVATSPLCSLGPGLLISAIKRDLSRSLIHHPPFLRIIVVLACNWKDLFLLDTWYCSCKCKVTSTALVFIQLHYCLESILKQLFGLWSEFVPVYCWWTSGSESQLALTSPLDSSLGKEDRA